MDRPITPVPIHPRRVFDGFTCSVVVAVAIVRPRWVVIGVEMDKRVWKRRQRQYERERRSEEDSGIS